MKTKALKQFFLLIGIFYRDLYKFEKSRDQAISAFQLHKISMHPVTAMLVSKDLGLEGQTA